MSSSRFLFTAPLCAAMPAVAQQFSGSTTTTSAPDKHDQRIINSIRRFPSSWQQLLLHRNGNGKQQRAVFCEQTSSGKPKSLQEQWLEKPAASRTTMDYYGAGPEWSRAWDDDWDGRHPDGKEELEELKKTRGKVIRHIFLIRHGQYNLDDKAHGLTELGKHQSKKTGERLRAMADGLKKDHYGEIKVQWKSVTSSQLLRAKETAEIIASELGMAVDDHDALLNEGTPCIPHPGGKLEKKKLSKLLTEPPRIEAAYREYVHRSTNWKKHKSKDEKDPMDGPAGASASAAKGNPQEGGGQKEDTTGGSLQNVDAGGTAPKTDKSHEYEVIVCHMNVIRYFVSRALQLPPETWLRMRGDNCGITEIIVYDDGRVSLGRFGDQGHLTIEETTFH